MEKKRSRLELRDGIQATLEGYRRFDYDYIAFGKKWFMPDGDFRYRQSLGGRLISGFFRTILQIFAPLLLKVAYGCRVVGKENRRALRKQGAIVITNHISYLDTLFVRAAVGHYRSFHTMAPWNNKKGVGGWFMRHAGLWAFSGNLAATKNLMREMERRDADIVIGSRFADARKPLSARMLGSRLIAGLIRLTTGRRVADPTSGMRLYNRRMMREFARRFDFGPEPDSVAYLMRHGARVREVQVEMRERAAGESYFNLHQVVTYMARTCTSILFVQWFR